jgi:hypothetical protein
MHSADTTALRLVALVSMLLLAGVATGSAVTAKAPPEPVCGVCTAQLDAAAETHGVSLNRGETSMQIQLTPNGTATFVAHVTLRNGSTQLQNESLRTGIVRDVSNSLVSDRRNLRTALVDDELRVRYSSRSLAHRTLGVLQFDAFHTRGAPPLASGGEGSPYPGADRLTLRAPPAYQPHGSPGAFSNETVVQWSGDSHEQYAGHIAEDTTISFVPRQARCSDPPRHGCEHR